MAKIKTYTVRSFMTMPDGSHKPWAVSHFEQWRNKDGTYSSREISTEFLMPEDERMAYEEKMSENLSRQLSTLI